MTDRFSRAFRRYTQRHLKRKAFHTALSLGHLPAEHSEINQWAVHYAERHGQTLARNLAGDPGYKERVVAAKLRRHLDEAFEEEDVVIELPEVRAEAA
jgi:hypothetical protein